MPLRIAMTGATGFVGAETLDQALDAGHHVNALTRRAQPPRARLKWVPGSLEDAAALDTLMRDADAVIHIAGVVNAPDRAGFEAGNARGTMVVVDAMRKRGVRRLVHVSSLAAREPELSDYGWSKERAERLVKASGLDWTIVRPPAIYGPGDREMLELFRMAKRGVMLLPPGGRLSVIEVSDLARLLLALPGETEMSLAETYEVDDGTPQGWDHRDFGQAIGRAVGRPVRTMATPAWLLGAGARMDGFFRGKGAKLTPDRVRYFCHPDWVAATGQHPPKALWTPEVTTEDGLRATVEAYRAKGWL
ncbi:nucleoside-diphosphate-sugar epimerase [Sphingobium wenxiniae]|nr:MULTISPECIES: NAD(P)H-binding protein [Sphingobium]KMS64302.1 epimerase [Sphingobium baderi LL03]MBB6190416.1 nucleoside-diphosphate-sugar epimerase [Sphingobium wenxiniae]TWH95134.1 nucleoside-diphosphate-sugar epimerase [Sphingobium wenxiniae]WRD74939.1 NAD(P)H-binding protein [Sphingobium baderi]